MKTLDTHTDKIVEACTRSNIPMDWLVPYLADKSDKTVTDVLDSILAYVDKIPADSVQGERIAAQQIDPLIEAGRKHQHALKKWILAADRCPTGNADTPECERWFKERWSNIEQLQSTQAISVDGLLAQINMLEAEFGGNGFESLFGFHYIEIESQALNNIKRGIEALAKVQ